MSHLPTLPTFSLIDIGIILVFLIQILWGAKLGFVPAMFALTGEILGLISGILYSTFLGQLIDKQFHISNLLQGLLSQKTSLPQIYASSFSQSLFYSLVFLVIFLGVQVGFFYLGKFIHHKVGEKRVAYFSNHFFGMFIGMIRGIIEIVFFLISWNALTTDPTIKASLVTFNMNSFTENSLLLPLFQHLIPATSPLSKFF